MSATTMPPRTTPSESTSAKSTTHRRNALRWTLLAIAAALVLVAVAYTYLKGTSNVAAAGIPDCGDVPVSGAATDPGAVEDVCGTIEGLVNAWSEHDAAAYGSAFTPEATYTTYAGTHYVGRQDIIDSHTALFAEVLSDTQLHHSYLAIQFLTSDVAVLTVRGDTYEGEQPGTPTKIQTYTLVHEDNQWSVAAFQNTQRKPIMERVQYLWMPETVPSAEQ